MLSSRETIQIFNMLCKCVDDLILDYSVGDRAYWKSVFQNVLDAIEPSDAQITWDEMALRNGWNVKIVHRIEWINTRKLQKSAFGVAHMRICGVDGIRFWSA